MDTRRHGLLHSPTGTGKTLAVWLGYLPRLLEGSPGQGLRALWVTPLRALASDTLESLEHPLSAVGHEGWSLELRTGDTSSSVKQRQNRHLPDVLVTTPESLTLMLTHKEAREKLSNLELVVVDEWHELMGTKRGIQAELALARLRQWSSDHLVWGLSATLGNTEEAATTLFGVGRDGVVIRGDMDKDIVVDSLLPASIESFPWAGHMGQRMVPYVVQELESAFSTLIFTNTRAQAEIWYQAILSARPEWHDQIGLHHGSLDTEVRREVEDGLKSGMLRAVVCTSSLDLGVDFGPVERCIQVGSPKGVARLIQRAGRSGHRPGATSRVTCVPTHTLELIDIAAAKVAVSENRIEARAYYDRPFDVLAQHLVTVALGGGFEPSDLLREIRLTRAYERLTNEEWGWVLDFVSKGGKTLSAYPEYQRVVVKDGLWVVEDRRIAMRHRMNVGTIVSDAAMTVQYVRGGKLGTVEESFVSRLKKGDVFLFSGRPLQFVQVKDMTCWVRRAASSKGAVPRWMGGRLPLSNELARSARERLEEAKNGILDGPEMSLAHDMFRIQSAWSSLPATDQLLIELVKSREGHHAFVFPFEGRLVHEGLAALVAYRMTLRGPHTFSLACNDYGFELLSERSFDLVGAIGDGLFSSAGVAEDVLASLNVSEMARRQFREIARVSGLVVQTAPGVNKTARQLQVSSGLLFDVFEKYDPGHPLLDQARREVLEKHLEESRMVQCLKRMGKSELLVTNPGRPTPFALPIMVDRLRQTVSSETFEDRINRLVESLEKAAS